ncbi:MAG: hypothetical protein JKY57_02260, partial [Kordiimonadaceae bacterium]|nr:hypothetical protein [Kordiimonadaceae bacterium]
LAGEAGRRLSATGILTLRAEAHSSQHRNRDDALARLKSLLLKAEKPKKYRAKTRPTRASNERRLASKTQRSTRKQTRGKVKFTD